MKNKEYQKAVKSLGDIVEYDKTYTISDIKGMLKKVDKKFPENFVRSLIVYMRKERILISQANGRLKFDLEPVLPGRLMVGSKIFRLMKELSKHIDTGESYTSHQLNEILQEHSREDLLESDLKNTVPRLYLKGYLVRQGSCRLYAEGPRMTAYKNRKDDPNYIQSKQTELELEETDMITEQEKAEVTVQKKTTEGFVVNTLTEALDKLNKITVKDIETPKEFMSLRKALDGLEQTIKDVKTI